MTPVQQQIHDRLRQVSPANYQEDHFIQQLASWRNKPMTEKGSKYMLALLKKYRKQIPDADQLRSDVIQEEIDGLGI